MTLMTESDIKRTISFLTGYDNIKLIQMSPNSFRALIKGSISAQDRFNVDTTLPISIGVTLIEDWNWGEP